MVKPAKNRTNNRRAALRLLRSRSGRVDATANLMRGYVQAAEPAKAEALGRARVRAGDFGARLLLADLLADKIGDRPSAERFYRESAAEGHPATYNNFGCFLSEDDARAAEAEEWFRRGMEEGDSLAALNLGKHLFDQQKYEPAIAVLLRAAQDGRTSALPYLARAESRLGRHGEAKQHARQGVEREAPTAHLAMAEVLAGGPLADEAAVEAQYLASVGESEEGAAFSFALWLNGIGRPQDALEHYRAAAEDGEANAYLNMGLVLRRLRRTDEAEEAFRAGIGHNDAQSAAALAELFYLTGRYGEISEAIRTARNLHLPADELAELEALRSPGEQ